MWRLQGSWVEVLIVIRVLRDHPRPDLVASAISELDFCPFPPVLAAVAAVGNPDFAHWHVASIGDSDKWLAPTS